MRSNGRAFHYETSDARPRPPSLILFSLGRIPSLVDLYHSSMSTAFDDHLKALGIELPTPRSPGANYVPFTQSGNLLFLTGQLSQWNGERRFIGKLGREFGLDQGQQAARLCALNLIAHIRSALDGDLGRVSRCVRLTGYINSTPDFTCQSQVMNGASDVFVQVFGDAGRHTRIAIGVAALPYDVAVEVEGIFEVR